MHNVKVKLLALLLSACCLGGCGGAKETTKDKAEKVFTYGTIAYGNGHNTIGLDPHSGYCGWSTVRYGVGETLFKFNDKMEPTPWLALKHEQIDPQTLKITLRDNVTFSSGRKLDGQAVKECLEDLVQKHDRAVGDLKISSIKAEGQTVTITSTQPAPVMLNYLCDPYGAIVDIKAGVSADKNVAGTGPFIAKKVTDNSIDLERNPSYWGGAAKVSKVRVRGFADGDTMTMALQAGDIDATQGLPYSSLDLFKKDSNYKVASVNTSRVFMAAMNYATPALQDVRVRQAIAMAIDKNSFTKVLLKDNGSPALGPFPSSMTFGGNKVHAYPFDLTKAKALLKEAGWEDSNKDGYLDKNGKNLTLRWLTYPGRIELPLLAESVQASLKALGIQITVNSTTNSRDFLKKGDWDIYASALVTAPTGDPEYFFTSVATKGAPYNWGKYNNDKVESLKRQLEQEFNKEKRGELAVLMAQQVVDDAAFVFASHLKMSFAMKKNVQNFVPHPSDYYEITNQLDFN